MFLLSTLNTFYTFLELLVDWKVTKVQIMSFTMVIFEDFLLAKCEVKLNPKLSPRFWFFHFLHILEVRWQNIFQQKVTKQLFQNNVFESQINPCQIFNYEHWYGPCICNIILLTLFLIYREIGYNIHITNLLQCLFLCIILGNLLFIFTLLVSSLHTPLLLMSILLHLFIFPFIFNTYFIMINILIDMLLFIIHI